MLWVVVLLKTMTIRELGLQVQDEGFYKDVFSVKLPIHHVLKHHDGGFPAFGNACPDMKLEWVLRFCLVISWPVLLPECQLAVLVELNAALVRR